MKKAILAAALAVSSIGMAHAAGFGVGVFGGLGGAGSSVSGGSTASSGSASIGNGVAYQGTQSGSQSTAVAAVSLNPSGVGSQSGGQTTTISSGGGFTLGSAIGGTSGDAWGNHNAGSGGVTGNLGFGAWTW